MSLAATPRLKEIALLIDSGGQRRRIPVGKWPFTIGRSEEADASIADFRVSRVHARLLNEQDEYFVVDAGSRHGTFVNGARCERAKLKNNDEITLGVPGLKITFVEGGSSSSAAGVLLTRFATDTDSSELEKLRLFLEAARSLTGGVVVTDVLRNMLDYALRLTKAERGFIYLKQPSGGPTLACGVDNKGNQLIEDRNVSHSVIDEALSSAAEFISGDTTLQRALAERQSIVMNELRTVIAVPLRTKRAQASAQGRLEIEGVLYLDSRLASRNLSGVGPDVLRALASECAAVLESARLMEAEQAARQYRQEMEIAASIQRRLISETEVNCDFARVRGQSIPCKEVGGDFFDVHRTDNAVTVILADVSGKGVSAALLASMIHGMFYAQISSGGGLVDAVSAVNRFLCSRVAGQKYATLFAAQLHRDGALEMINCGHVPAMIARDGQVAQVTEGDLPVGLIAQSKFHSIQQPFPPGSRLCLISDGINEAENAQGVDYGTAEVERNLLAQDPMKEILASVSAFCGNCEPQDDRTVVILERTQ